MAQGRLRPDELRPSGFVLAHAPAAVSRPVHRAICAAVDAVARAEGLLGHGASAQGVPECACHVQCGASAGCAARRSEEHTSELQSLRHLVCRLLLEKKKTTAL